MTDAAPPPSTPSRRANAPSHLRDWVYDRALQFGYYEGGKTKEEKQAFISALTKTLNERNPETGTWDDLRSRGLVGNLRKERGGGGKENPPRERPQKPLSPSALTAPPAAAPLRPIQRLLRDWQAALLSASALNSASLARHTTNRGCCNEDLVRGFLEAILGSRLVGVGSGEVLSRDSDAPPPRQVDVLLYNTEYPRLVPARFASSAGSPCACFYPESVLAIVEVKTTLTNQDLRDVCTAAQQLAPLMFFILAFDSQSTLRAIDCSAMPENVMGIYTLSHGSLVRCEDGWQTVFPSQRPPLEMFYSGLLDALSCEPSLNALACSLQTHLEGYRESNTSEDAVLIENALEELDNSTAVWREIQTHHCSLRQGPPAAMLQATRVLPAAASAYEEKLELPSPSDAALIARQNAGRFLAAPSVVTSIGAALNINYTTAMTKRLWQHFLAKTPVPDEHVFTNAVNVIYVHEQAARLFAQWLLEQGLKRRADNERRKKKRSAPPASATTSSFSSPDGAEANSPSRLFRVLDMNVPAAAAAQPKPAKRACTNERDNERALALENLKARISELHGNAKFFMRFTKTEHLPVDEAAAEVTELLLGFERAVVVLAMDDVEEYLTKYCPAAISKIEWKRLSFRKSVAPAIPDVEQIFSMQPIPSSVPLLCK